MSRTRVLLVGAAGETGGSIANGLLENPTFVRIPLVLFYLFGKFNPFSSLPYPFIILFGLRSICFTCPLTNCTPAGTVRPRASPIRSETGHPLPAGPWCSNP